MIKTRIIPTLLYKNYTLVKGVKFHSWRRVGSLVQAVKVYNMREVDELVFLDIAATLENRPPDFHLVDDFADECFMPLAVGGGIRTPDDIQKLLQCGADKVVLNTTAFVNPDIVKDSVQKFGSQCIMISIDAKKTDDHSYKVCIRSGTETVDISPVEFAKKMEALGAGEILLTSVDRDGTMEGYDLDLIRSVGEAVSIPVIASGGAGKYEHILDALIKAKASSIAAASIFHFTEVTPQTVKQYLKKNGINVRI